ncbi:MAG: UPF0262 family protein [Stellaceae bacterium]
MAGRNLRIAEITLDEHTVVRRSADIEHERATAIFDLLEDNSFDPTGGAGGPFRLHLAVEGTRLVIDIRSADGAALDRISLALGDFRPIIKDYFLVCESYNDAIRRAPLSRITAIDQGRRAMHNEASEMLRERLAPQVAVDLDTARRLFTLICVLQIRG